MPKRQSTPFNDEKASRTAHMMLQLVKCRAADFRVCDPNPKINHLLPTDGLELSGYLSRTFEYLHLPSFDLK